MLAVAWPSCFRTALALAPLRIKQTRSGVPKEGEPQRRRPGSRLDGAGHPLDWRSGPPSGAEDTEALGGVGPASDVSAQHDSRGAQEHKDSRWRIDAAVPAIMAHDRAAILAGNRGPDIYVR
jgi:hypothetical protein